MPPGSTPPPGRPGSFNFPSSFTGPLVERLFRPSLPAIDTHQFQGQTILVVFNEHARQGRFAQEADSLQRNLEAMGFDVVFLRTVANPMERSRLIREAARGLLNNPA